MKFTCPHCNNEVEIVTPEVTRRGVLSGIALEDMTDEQLKREIINAKSVLYKSEKRGASIETIAKNKDRVEAALAEKAKRTPVVEAEAPVAEVNGDVNAESVYEDDVNEDLASEI